jgi:hypothetical protein
MFSVIQYLLYPEEFNERIQPKKIQYHESSLYFINVCFN